MPRKIRRSEEHTSELQSRRDLVCRLLLEKKKILRRRVFSMCLDNNNHSVFKLYYHLILIFFFFNDTATTEIYTLSLHDALPIAMDFTQLREFMRGIRDGGPTRSGHATPCVFVTSGIIALDEAYARANTWIMTQFLDAGVHGVHICHARDPKAVEVLAQEGCRYPFLDYPTPKVARRGLRGSSAGFAAQIWGMGGAEYCAKADLWPLNPNGELIFGVKIEDTLADPNCDATIGVS